MARARNIKPGFFDNEILGELPALTRLLFIGLWCLADREGRLQDRPKRIKKELLGYDDVTADDVDTMLQQLNDNGFIQRYEIAGEQYIQVTNFLKHQNPHCKEQASVIPAPDGEDMGLGVVAGIHVKGRTGTAENSQDLRTYQTEKEQEIKKMHDLHAKLGVQLLNKATRGLIALPDNELSAQDIARLADVGVKIERMSRGDSAESIAVSAKATVEHSGGLELSGSIPDMSDLSDEELENLEQILGKLHK